MSENFKISIEAARVNAKLKCQEAADLLGISYATLRNYETGAIRPTERIIIQMCFVYSVPLEMLDINPQALRRPPDPGLYKTRLYRIFRGMVQRCYNPNNPAYYLYGEKGVSICDEWLNDFNAFYNWAIENGYNDELTIDRIDNNGNYCPENCRWITLSENSSRVWRNPETLCKHHKAYYEWLRKHRNEQKKK